MATPLEVIPRHMYSTSAELTTAQTAAGNAVAASATSVVPVPAGADPVSLAASAAFAAYAPAFLRLVADGFGKSMVGAQALVPAGVNYETTDTVHGQAIVAPGATGT